VPQVISQGPCYGLAIFKHFLRSAK